MTFVFNKGRQAALTLWLNNGIQKNKVSFSFVCAKGVIVKCFIDYLLEYEKLAARFVGYHFFFKWRKSW